MSEAVAHLGTAKLETAGRGAGTGSNGTPGSGRPYPVQLRRRPEYGQPGVRTTERPAIGGPISTKRDMPDFLELADAQRENSLVFRLWVASRIGVPEKTLAARIAIEPLARPYLSE